MATFVEATARELLKTLHRPAVTHREILMLARVPSKVKE